MTNSADDESTSWLRKLGILLLGILFTLVCLEGGLRLGGYAFKQVQRYQNQRALADKNACRIMAERHYVEGIKRRPRQFPGYWIALADLYDLQGETDKFLATLHLAPEVDRGAQSYFLGSLARHQYRQGGFDDGASFWEEADRLIRQSSAPMTREIYRQFQRVLGRQGIPLVCDQYPCRDVEELKALFDTFEGLTFVDNGPLFKRAVAEHGYRGIFFDYCNGDFGHATRLGNRILAENIADSILNMLDLNGQNLN